MWKVEQVRSLPWTALQALVRESEDEGFRFLRRLTDEWHSAANRFDKPNEAFFTLLDGKTLLAVCGLNVDPYQPDPRVARLRHMYVAASARGRSVGTHLLRRVLEYAGSSGAFDRIRLRTDTASAARFYEGRGFHRCRGEALATHELELQDWKQAERD